MTFNNGRDRLGGLSPQFGLLRAKIESEVARPAVLVVVSSTTEDGAGIVASGLAGSLALTGYATVLLDSSPVSVAAGSPIRPTLEEAARELKVDARDGRVSILNIGAPSSQETTNKRKLRSGLDALCGKFDYVVTDTQHGDSTPFGVAIIDSADAVLVSVQMGRRRKKCDTELALALDRAGSRFLGAVAVDASVIRGAQRANAVPDCIVEWRYNDVATFHKDSREALEWP